VHFPEQVGAEPAYRRPGPFRTPGAVRSMVLLSRFEPG
jgi:hypothetical protein